MFCRLQFSARIAARALSRKRKRGKLMRTITSIMAVLTISTSANAQDKALIETLQKLDVKVFKADSADAKLRGEALRQLRENVNQRDVEAWRKIKTKADWEAFRDEKVAALRKSLGNFP